MNILILEKIILLICSKQWAFLLLMLLCTIIPEAKAQTNEEKKTLEENRQKLEERLAKTNRVLEQIQLNKTGELSRLRTLNSEMHQREALVKQIENELFFITQELSETSEIIDALEKDMTGLREEYAAMLYMLSKSQNKYGRLSYIFSSSSLNQLMARLNYFGQYKEFRHFQIEQIMEVKHMLDTKRLLIEKRHIEQESLLESSKQQTLELAALRKEQSELLDKLRAQESQILIQIEEEQKALALLDGTVNELVNAKQAPEAVTMSVSDSFEIQAIPKSNLEEAATQTISAKATPEKLAEKRAFAQLKNQLPWPVKEGFVSRKFGKQEHPVFEGIWIENLGLDIATNDSEPILAVFSGEVIAVSKVPSMQHIITLQHGNYFTVYARLDRPQVTVGQFIEQGTILGIAGKNQDGIPELQFQIWHEQRKLDPESWLVQ